MRFGLGPSVQIETGLDRVEAALQPLGVGPVDPRKMVQRRRPNRLPPRLSSIVAGAVEPDAGETAAARPRNGATLRTAARHSSRSPGAGTGLFAFAITRFLAVVDENDMETPGSVGTELDALLDISRPRRPGDEIDRPRHPAIGPQPIPAILIGGDHLIRIYENDMGVGQKIQRRRGLCSGDQH